MQLYEQFEPLVSVVLPTYNRAEYLPRAINSVTSQTLQDWELLIVDDGSEDETFRIVKSYQEKFPSIRYLSHTNRKTPLSLNAGILAACGTYITFLGSDDRYRNDHLEIRVKMIEENSEVDILHGGVEIIGDPYVKDKNDFSKKVHLSECTIGATLFAQKGVFINLGGFSDLPYSDDSEFMERAIKVYRIMKAQSKSYIYYRDTPDSICNNI